MLRTLILSTDPIITAGLEQALAGTGDVDIVGVVDTCPGAAEAAWLVRETCPQLLFVGAEAGTAFALQLESIARHVQVIVAGRARDAEQVAQLMEAGVREFLAWPFERSTVEACLRRVRRNRRVLTMPPITIQSWRHWSASPAPLPARRSIPIS